MSPQKYEILFKYQYFSKNICYRIRTVRVKSSDDTR